MKKHFKRLLAWLMVCGTILCLPTGVLAEEEEAEEEKPLDMAYNIYSEPMFTTERKFDTFMIEMRSDLDPDCTYWSLANFQMYISDETKALYRDISGGHVYAGLQHSGGVRKAIMAFWEWHYWPNGVTSGEEETNLVAERIYPSGGNAFGGEGEGTNCIRTYNWDGGKWYRMVLHTWQDPVSHTTYCGQWVQDVASGEYTLISYFDTKMLNSYMTGDMSFFMENFYGINAGEERDVKLKNTYVRLYETKEWVSVSGSILSHCNNWAGNKTGNHSFGATEEYFWGKAGGFIDPSEQDALDEAQRPQKFTIDQPDVPRIETPKIKELRLCHRSDIDQHYIKWYPETDSTPMLSYTLKVTDVKGNELFTTTKTAPEMVYCVLDGVASDAYKCELSITDIFGQSTYYVNATEAYLAQKPDTLIGAEGNLKTVQITNQETAKPGAETNVDENSGVFVWIICGGAGAALLLIATPVLVVFKKKGKSKKASK